MVFVSYCTADVHLGERRHDIDRAGPEVTRPLAIRHRGHVNVMAALRWVYANFMTPREVFVAGTSAGAVATPFYASVPANHYPRARVVALGDDAGTYERVAMAAVETGRWRFHEGVRQEAGWADFPVRWGVEDLYVAGSLCSGPAAVPGSIMRTTRRSGAITMLAGTPAPDLLALLRASRARSHRVRIRDCSCAGPLNEHGQRLCLNCDAELVTRLPAEWLAQSLDVAVSAAARRDRRDHPQSTVFRS